MNIRKPSRRSTLLAAAISVALLSIVGLLPSASGGGATHTASAAQVTPTTPPTLAQVCAEIAAQLTAGDANLGGFYCSDPWVSGGNFSGGPVALTVSPTIESYTAGGPTQQVNFTVSGELPANALPSGESIEMNWASGVSVLAKYRKPLGAWSKWFATTTVNTYEPLQFANPSCSNGPTRACIFDVAWDASVVTNPFFADAEWAYYVKVRGDGVYPCPGPPGITCTGSSFGAVATMAGGANNNVQPPVADFTISPAALTPGSYQLVSTTTNPNGGALDQTWTVSGGATSGSVGPAITVTFDKPGTYTATLSVRDAVGLTDSISKTIDVAAPKLSVAISPNTSTTPTLGSVVPIHVQVSASGDGVGALTGITFDSGAILAAAPAGLADLSGMPAAPAAFDLQPGTNRGFDVPVTVTAFGTITLTSAISGFDSIGRALHDAALRTIATSPLNVAVVVDPSSLELKSNDAGPIPDTVKATITVTNESAVDITNVSLQRLQPAWADPADAAETLPVRQIAGPTPTALAPEQLGTLTPGQSKQVTATFEVSDSGKLAIEAQAFSSAGAASGSGTFDVTSDVILFVDAHPTGFTPPAKPGQTVLLTGYLKNTSRTDTLVIDPFQAGFIGHGAGGFPLSLDLGLSPASSSADVCRASVPVEIKPRASWSFSMLVSVSPAARVGPNRVTVQMPKPKGTVLAADKSKSALAPTRVRVIANAQAIELVVDQADPPVVEGDFLTEFGHLTIGFDKGLRNGALGLGELIHSLPTIGGQLLHAPRAVLDEAMKDVDYLNMVWDKMPESEKFTFAATLQAWSDAWSQSAPGQAGPKAREVIERFAQELGTLQATNELEFAQKIGALGGQLGFDTASGAITEMFICGLARRVGLYGKYIDAAEKTAEATQSERVAARELKDGKGLAAMTSGEEFSIETIRKYTGTTPSELQRVVDVAEANHAVIAFRSRSARAAELIELGQAVLKNEVWKVKTVSDIDYLYLGYRKSDEAIAVLRTPISEIELEQRIGTLPKPQADLVRKRWQDRVAEWSDPTPDHPKYKHLHTDYLARNADGWVDVPFDPTLNLPGESQQAITHKYRRTALEPVTAPKESPGDYWIIKQAKDAGPNAKLFPIVGDIDMIAILDESMRVFESADVRLKIYDDLQRAVGIQHGESFTLQLENARRDFLEAHLPGKEPLIIVHPDGKVRAGYFDPSKSYAKIDVEAKFIYLEGQELNLTKRPGSSGLLDFPNVVDTPTNAFITPVTWKELGIGIRDVLIDRAGGIFRATPKGIEEWNPSSRVWVTSGLTTTNGLLHVSPQTATGAAPAGSRELPIAKPSDLGLAPDVPWFHVGDQVVVDPGGPNQQIATVVAFGSLILDRPLTHDILAGTTVAMIAQGGLPKTGTDSSALVWFAAFLSIIGAAMLAVSRPRRVRRA